MALRAVYDDGAKRSEGHVKSTWSSGLVVETTVRPAVGSPLALVVLAGGFDGDRLYARVTAVEKNGVMLELPGLDAMRWMRLVALVDGTPMNTKLPPGPPPPAPPANAATLILSSDVDELEGDPTGLVTLTPDMRKEDQKPRGPAPHNPSPFERAMPLPPTGSGVAAPRPAPAPVTGAGVAAPARQPPPVPVEAPFGAETLELEQQIAALAARNATLSAENARLKGELARAGGVHADENLKLKGEVAKAQGTSAELAKRVAALTDELQKAKSELSTSKAMKSAGDDELKDALQKLDDIEKVLNRR